jgi:hypothetical protein
MIACDRVAIRHWHALPEAERAALEAAVRPGYRVTVLAQRGLYDLTVRVYPEETGQAQLWFLRCRDIRFGIERAIAWIETHDTATYDGMEVPVR